MKKIAAFLFAACLSVAASAKDIRTVVVTTVPQMHCASCENKIKENLRFERGVKAIDTNVGKQTVTVKYDADKTDVEKILKGFTRFGYTAKVVKECTEVQKAEKKK